MILPGTTRRTRCRATSHRVRHRRQLLTGSSVGIGTSDLVTRLGSSVAGGATQSICEMLLSGLSAPQTTRKLGTQRPLSRGAHLSLLETRTAAFPPFEPDFVKFDE